MPDGLASDRRPRQSQNEKRTSSNELAKNEKRETIQKPPKSGLFNLRCKLCEASSPTRFANPNWCKPPSCSSGRLFCGGYSFVG